MDPRIFLGVIGFLAVLVVIGTVVAIIIILRQPNTQKPNTATNATGDGQEPVAPIEDAIEGDAGQEELIEFELTDVSSSFRGVSQNRQRDGVILHLTQPDAGLISFKSQAFSEEQGSIIAETVYGKMEVIIAQGKAGVKWDDEPLGVLDYSNQRILGAEGQILGSMERPLESEPENGYYPIGFYGQHMADVSMAIQSIATLRWFDDQDTDSQSAYQNIAEELDDVQTLLLIGAFLLEVGFFDVLAE